MNGQVPESDGQSDDQPIVSIYFWISLILLIGFNIVRFASWPKNSVEVDPSPMALVEFMGSMMCFFMAVALVKLGFRLKGFIIFFGIVVSQFAQILFLTWTM